MTQVFAAALGIMRPGMLNEIDLDQGTRGVDLNAFGNVLSLCMLLTGRVG